MQFLGKETIKIKRVTIGHDKEISLHQVNTELITSRLNVEYLKMKKQQHQVVTLQIASPGFASEPQFTNKLRRGKECHSLKYNHLMSLFNLKSPNNTHDAFHEKLTSSRCSRCMHRQPNRESVGGGVACTCVCPVVAEAGWVGLGGKAGETRL